jgi:hypothetical protein
MVSMFIAGEPIQPRADCARLADHRDSNVAVDAEDATLSRSEPVQYWQRVVRREALLRATQIEWGSSSSASCSLVAASAVGGR